MYSRIRFSLKRAIYRKSSTAVKLGLERQRGARLGLIGVAEQKFVWANEKNKQTAVDLRFPFC